MDFPLASAGIPQDPPSGPRASAGLLEADTSVPNLENVEFKVDLDFNLREFIVRFIPLRDELKNNFTIAKLLLRVVATFPPWVDKTYSDGDPHIWGLRRKGQEPCDG